jgi:CRISPR-associated protein Cas1
MAKNLQELPRFADRLTYLYVERARIEQAHKSIALEQFDGTTEVPVAGLAVLILGPGTTITHAAIRTLAESNCQVLWAGENGVRFYAQGFGGTRQAKNILHQARLVSNELTRLQVVIRMYCQRFDEPVPGQVTLQQLRGMEGIRVRQAYAEAAKAHGIEWHGRSYDREKWDYSDPINRALSAGNSCLYGLVSAALLSAGYSTALGFIHTGKQLSFVYDIADLYKADYIIPLAFQLAAQKPPEIDRAVRIECRRLFAQKRLIEKIIPDVARVLDVPVAELDLEGDPYAEDAALPAEWWDPKTLATDVPIEKILCGHWHTPE